MTGAPFILLPDKDSNQDSFDSESNVLPLHHQAMLILCKCKKYLL